MRKDLGPGAMAVADQVGYLPAPAQQFLEEALQRHLISIEPFHRDLPGSLVQNFRGEMRDLIEPRLKVVQRFHILVYKRTQRQTLERGIRKFPIRPVENETLVDHLCDEPGSPQIRSVRRRPLRQAGTEIDGLPPVDIPHPFVRHQNAKKMSQIRHLPE